MAAASLSPVEALVLRILERGSVPLSGRAIARIAGLSQSTTQRALARLRGAGLVVADEAPPSLLYRVNRDHLAIPSLLALLHLDDELRRRMGEHVAHWRTRPLAVIVYGSVARGTAGASSDVDVLVVRPNGIATDEAPWQDQLAELAAQIERWTGRPASVIELSGHEAAQGMIEREPFLVEADHEGWLIAGRSLRDLAAGRT